MARRESICPLHGTQNGFPKMRIRSCHRTAQAPVVSHCSWFEDETFYGAIRPAHISSTFLQDYPPWPSRASPQPHSAPQMCHILSHRRAFFCAALQPSPNHPSKLDSNITFLGESSLGQLLFLYTLLQLWPVLLFLGYLMSSVQLFEWSLSLPTSWKVLWARFVCIFICYYIPSTRHSAWHIINTQKPIF